MTQPHNKKRKTPHSEEESVPDNPSSSKRQKIAHDESLASKEAEFDPLAIRISNSIQSDSRDTQDSQDSSMEHDEAPHTSASPEPFALETPHSTPDPQDDSHINTYKLMDRLKNNLEAVGLSIPQELVPEDVSGGVS
jgi:hypothetical protein